MTRYPLIFRLPAALALMVLVTACGSSRPQQSPGSSQLKPAGPSEQAIAEAVYFDRRVPDGFYRETQDDGNFYSISHIRNVDLLPPAQRAGVTVYPLAADSYSRALDWDQLALRYQSGNRQLVDSSETFLYYQFTHVDPAAPRFVYMQRIFRAQLLDRQGVDGNYLGRVVDAGISAQQAKQLVEYLWSFSDSNNYGNAILASTVTETGQAIEVILQQAMLHAAGEVQQCDTIDVHEIRYVIDRSSGFIRRQSVLQQVVSARRDGSAVEICR